MLDKLQALIFPFQTIAKELTSIRELYELELENRPVPIRRVTERPREKDTEVFYEGEEVPKRRWESDEDGFIDGEQ